MNEQAISPAQKIILTRTQKDPDGKVSSIEAKKLMQL